jgi:hypothetical protein
MLVVLQAELGNRKMNDSIRISLQSVPLSQDIEHRDCVGKPHLEVIPDAVHHFLEMIDKRQHRKDRLNNHSYLPCLALADLQVRGVAFFGMKDCIRQHNHFFFKASDQRLKMCVGNISGRALPSHYQPVLVQEQAEFAAHDPAPVRQPFAPTLLRARTLSDRVNQLDTIGVNHAHHTRCGQEPLGQMAVRPKQPKQSCSFWQMRKQMRPIPRQPAIKGTVADAFQSKQEGQGDDLAWIEPCSRVFLNVEQLFINAKEQFYGKFFGGHGLQSLFCIGLVANTLGDEIVAFFN